MNRKNRFIRTLLSGIITLSIGAGFGFGMSTDVLAAQSNSLDFDAQPAHPSSLDHSITSYFYEKGNPGETLSESLTLVNPNDYPIQIQPSIVDAKTGINGGVAYDNHPSSLSWIKGFSEQITVEPKKTKNVSFQIAVPQNAGVGDHIFGIALIDHSPTKVQQQQSKSDMSVQINEQVRRVIAVQIAVSGQPTTHIDLNTASILNEPSGASLDIQGINNSNVLLRDVSGKITLSKDNKELWAIPLSKVTLVPNAPFEFKYRWTDGHPDMGTYKVSVDLNGSQIGNVHKDLSFDISVEKLKQYQNLTGNKAVQSYIPQWVYYVGAVVVLMLVGCATLLLSMYRKMKVNSNNQSI